MGLTIKVKTYTRNGIKVKSHRRTLPDGICSNNIRKKKCMKKKK